jgi:hypothetical protein
MRPRTAIILSTIALTACASSGVIPIDKGTYLITKRSTQVGTGAPVGTKAKVYAEANAFCAKNGQALETVNLEMSASRVAHPGSVELQFRCVPR